MTKLIKIVFAGVMILSSLSFAQTVEFVLTGDKLNEGFNMGVDSSEKQFSWVNNIDKTMRLSYPPNQSYGAVFITVGPPVDTDRPSMDLSAYKWLIVEMRGDSGGEKIKIGIKTNTQRDDGSEYKVAETLTSEWKEYRYPLSRFAKADSKRLYVVAEFVFEGKQASTVFVRSVKYAQ